MPQRCSSVIEASSSLQRSMKLSAASSKGAPVFCQFQDMAHAMGAIHKVGDVIQHCCHRDNKKQSVLY